MSDIYLDSAASTPLRPEVLAAMMPFLDGERFGNPSSGHRRGREARAAVDAARRQIAHALGAEPRQVIFTSGGTEADNLAVMGTARRARAERGRARIAVSRIEHKAVLEAAQEVADTGGELAWIPVEADGLLNTDALEEELEHQPDLVSVMWVNNETGIIQDVETTARACREAGAAFHCDAVQALGKIPIDMGALEASYLAISGHKIGGPPGIGALIVRDRDSLNPILKGGGQQHGIRPGTENVPGIIGLGRAVELAAAEVDSNREDVERLRDRWEDEMVKAMPEVTVVGSAAPRAPHISQLLVPGTRSDDLITQLDQRGVACSSGSACNTGTASPSHVILALGHSEAEARTALRFSFSHLNGMDDVDRLLELFPEVVSTSRKLAEALS